MDRGCSKLREEIMYLCLAEPGLLPHLFQWIARNFAMFARRNREGFNVMKREGFTLLNRAKLCSYTSMSMLQSSPPQPRRLWSEVQR
jgi:hypothetical protein